MSADERDPSRAQLLWSNYWALSTTNFRNSIILFPKPVNQLTVRNLSRIDEEGSHAPAARTQVSPDGYERMQTKDTLLALRYLNLGVDAIPGERPAHQVLGRLLALRGLRNESFKRASIAPLIALWTGGVLPPDILRQIENLISQKKREELARIRCQSLSKCSPEMLVSSLFDRLNPSIIDNILGELAPAWGFLKPDDCAWSEYFDSNLLNQRDQVMADLWTSKRVDKHAYPDDPHMVLMAAIQDGMSLRYASESLRDDREIVLAALEQTGWALRFTSDRLYHDREIVLAAVRQEGRALLEASRAIKNDREIVLAAVRKDGMALQYASETLKNDHEIVLAAVEQKSWALKLASRELKNDRKIVLAAVKSHGWTLGYASETLQNDREIVLAAVKQSGRAIVYASERIKYDREILLAAFRQDRSAFHFSPFLGLMMRLVERFSVRL